MSEQRTFICKCGGTVSILYSKRKNTPLGNCDSCHKWFSLDTSNSSPWVWSTGPVLLELTDASQATLLKKRRRFDWKAKLDSFKEGLSTFYSLRWFEFRTYRGGRGLFLRVYRIYVQLYRDKHVRLTFNAGVFPKMKRV